MLNNFGYKMINENTQDKIVFNENGTIRFQQEENLCENSIKSTYLPTSIEVKKLNEELNDLTFSTKITNNISSNKKYKP